VMFSLCFPCHLPLLGHQLCRDPGTGTMREGNIGRVRALSCRYTYSPEPAAGENVLEGNNFLEYLVS
jgi:hypothetical protein